MIGTEVARNNYIGNGAVSDYDFDFKILAATDLVVVIRNTTSGVETTLVKDTDYIVNGTLWENGGSITLLDAGQAWLDPDGDLDTGYNLSILRDRPITQESDIRNQRGYFPEIHEDAFDSIIMICQQLQDQLDRALVLPSTDTASGAMPSLEARANKFLAFDADGEPIASAGGIDGALPVSSFIETLLDDADASAARTTLGAASQTAVEEAQQTADDALAAIQAPFLVGEVKMYGSITLPSGWLACDGSAVNRTTYADLFAVIGETFGPGNGTTTFNLPDFKGRMPIGVGAGSGLTSRTIADKSGAETHTHAIPHRHGSPVISQGGASFAFPFTDIGWPEGYVTESVTIRGVSVSGFGATTPANLLKTKLPDTANSSAGNGMNPFLCISFMIYAGV